MVYFNCGKCGGGLRKNEVEKHMFTCRSRIFSCIDCNKDFMNDEYKAHIKCVTESERYESKSSYVSKVNKGEAKQNAWFDKVIQAVQSFRGSQRARQILEKLTDYPNVPRKKVKFFNFMRNSFRSYGVNDAQLEEIWVAIESFDKPVQQTQSNQFHQSQSQQQHQNTKRKLEDEQTSETAKQIKLDDATLTTESEIENNAKFDWFESIKNELSKVSTDESTSNEISLKKLQKKLFKKYKKFTSTSKQDDEDVTSTDGSTNTEEKFIKKLSKKLKKFSGSFKARVENEEDPSKIYYQYIATQN